LTERFLTLSDDNGSASASGELGQKIGRSNDNKQVISRRHCGSPHSISGHSLSQSSIPSGHVQQWLEQAAQFRAEIDAQEPNQELRPESLKDKIMVEWLDLDPDRLADEVQVEQGAYIRWETLAHYAKQHRNAAFEAFAGYKGSHTTDRPGCAYPSDWMEFLDALRKAREIAADPAGKRRITACSITD
jgi:hypothetical protein